MRTSSGSLRWAYFRAVTTTSRPWAGSATIDPLTPLMRIDCPFDSRWFHSNSGAPHEIEVLVRTRLLQTDRKGRVEVAVEGRDRDRGIGVLGDRDREVAGVAREPVGPAVQQRPDEVDVPVHGAGLDQVAEHAIEHHVAVHRLDAHV